MQVRDATALKLDLPDEPTNAEPVTESVKDLGPVTPEPIRTGILSIGEHHGKPFAAVTPDFTLKIETAEPEQQPPPRRPGP